VFCLPSPKIDRFDLHSHFYDEGDKTIRVYVRERHSKKRKNEKNKKKTRKYILKSSDKHHNDDGVHQTQIEWYFSMKLKQITSSVNLTLIRIY
jgi:hypothetical protein